METMQVGVNGTNQLAVLETKLKKKANGTFLWVILVLQGLLNAHENGATLGEIEKILQRVPPDLENFYQHQMESTMHDDRSQVLSMLQCVFYSLDPLSPTELRYLLAFGHEDFSSYSKWAQSSEYVTNDVQMENRIREKSKGLIEIVELPKERNTFKAQYESKKIVQFIHQTVKDFLFKTGFGSLRRGEIPNDAASGHDFMKIACLNYLNTTNLKELPILDFRFYSNNGVRCKMPTLREDHPLLEYAVDHLFPHAALAEQHGIQQDGLRSHMFDNIQGSFELWVYLKNLISTIRHGSRSACIGFYWRLDWQGFGARPLHVFAQYGLLAPGVAIPKEDPNLRGGPYDYPLFAAAAGGHQRAVEFLLMSGADPQISCRHGQTAYGWAAVCGDVNVLRLLLEHPSSVRTLQQRIKIARWIKNPISENGNESILSPHQIHEIFALLFPEDTISVSAIDEIFELFTSPPANELVVSLLLDKCEKDVLRRKTLLYECVKNHHIRIPLIQKLLDCTESIEMSQELLYALHFRGKRAAKDAETLTRILFERSEGKITERFIDNVSFMRNSSQILHQLAVARVELPPLTYRQTMSALEYGSADSVAYFVQHAPDDATSDDMLLAAVLNGNNATEAVRVLLGLRNMDSVCEATVISSLNCRKHSLSLLKTFEDRWGTLVFSIDTLIAALYDCEVDVVSFVLSRYERSNITESLITAALRGLYSPEKVHLLLEYDPTFRVQGRLLAKTVTEICDEGVLDVYVRHGNPLVLTEEVVKAATRNSETGVQSLKIILQHNSDVEISNTMVLEALRSPWSVALITLMLENDPSIAMQEAFLIAAASNTHNGALLFEALHRKGRISFSTSAVEATDDPPAKRQRLSLGPSISLKDKETKTAQITTKVIEAAAKNGDKFERWQLLSLFQTWGVLTEAKLELYRCPDSGMDTSDSES